MLTKLSISIAVVALCSHVSSVAEAQTSTAEYATKLLIDANYFENECDVVLNIEVASMLIAATPAGPLAIVKGIDEAIRSIIPRTVSAFPAFPFDRLRDPCEVGSERYGSNGKMMANLLLPADEISPRP